MKKNYFIYLNDHWVPLKKAGISPMDHGFLYGDGVFETIRSYDGYPFKLTEHLNRLTHSCKSIHLSLPESHNAIRRIVYKTLEMNKIKEGYIRIMITRGIGAIGIDPSLCQKPTFIVMTFPVIPPPLSYYSKGISLGIVKTLRNYPKAIPADIKSSNFLNNILAKIEAKKSGVHEGILLNQKGYISEGTVSNLFYFKNSILITPSRFAGILEGITRNTVIEIARDNGLKVVEKLFKPKELLLADECFITNTGYEIMPATKINAEKIGNGKPGLLTRKLMEIFKDYIALEQIKRRF